MRPDYLTRIQPKGKKAMSRKPVAVALPEELDEWVRSLPNRSEWLRKAITEAYERENSD
jgi:Arc/MetJ-type ribon-helix-helix transcriptional regulator